MALEWRMNGDKSVRPESQILGDTHLTQIQ